MKDEGKISKTPVMNNQITVITKVTYAYCFQSYKRVTASNFWILDI